MNASQIEKNVAALVKNFNKEEFIPQLMIGNEKSDKECQETKRYGN